MIFTLGTGTTQQLTLTAKDQAGNTLTSPSVTWATADGPIATVSSTGMVTAVGKGTTTVTATANGKIGSASVSVSGGGATVAFTSVVAGSAHSCALTSTGAAYCWGRGEAGQLGITPPATMCSFDTGPLSCSLVPVAVSGGLSFVQLTAGGAHTCGLTSGGVAYCWGNNVNGQVGDNTTNPRNAPVAVATGLTFTRIDAGASHTCALTSDGKVYCWGSNGRGQLGDGSTTNRPSPVAVASDSTFQSVVAGGLAVTELPATIGQTCALTTGGTTYCWGDNELGQLGIGTLDANPHATPLKVSGAPVFASLATGMGRHACGLTSAGAAHCWGDNTYGALGTNSTTSSQTPVAVSGGLTFTRLIAGGYVGHTCGLSSAGAAYCWGDNERGAIGDGSAIDRVAPTAVIGSLTFASLDAGSRHTCGITTGGTVYCWGSGSAGQLGTNSVKQSNLPARVVGQP